MFPSGQNRNKPEPSQSSEESEIFDLRPTSSGTGKKIIVGIGAIIVLFAITDYVNSKRRMAIKTELAPRSSSREPGRDMMFGGPQASHVLENPEISWFDRVFCTGYKKSSVCSNKTLHPFYKYYVEERYKELSEEDAAKLYGSQDKVERIPGKSRENAQLVPQILNSK